MTTVLEKLGITEGPWEVNPVHLFDENAEMTVSFYEKRAEQGNNGHVLNTAPEMLEALIMCRRQGFNTWKDFQSHIERVIEKATGKTWSEVKQILEEAE